MSLHNWLGRHIADHKASHWERGCFVTSCTICGRDMVKLPGLGWQIRTAAS